jgi:spermidine/putrescine ABC transporter ATP-binding subunit
MAATIISIKHVFKDFGSVRAVNDANFEIAEGEFFSLLGPSGCGKTTLLRMLAGFEVPTQGSIHIDGKDVTLVPPNHRPVNMVFQNYAIFPHLNVASNIAFGMRKSGLSKRQLADRIEEMLELIRLPGYGERTAMELSGGQRQRVALARALIKQPKVLLLDEPLGALDKKLREQMQIELRQLQQQVGITFVFVTHDQEEALTLSDRIAVMSQGDVLEISTPGALYEAPKSRFVADFIGTMNFFDCALSECRNGVVTADSAELGRVRAACDAPPAAAGEGFVLGIRPEKFQLAFEDVGATENAVKGLMGPSAYLGDRSHFYVYLEGRAEPVSVALPNLAKSLDRISGVGQEVWLTWSDHSAVLLPSEEGAG